MRCNNCGTENRAGSKFCRQCGSPLEPIENTIPNKKANKNNSTTKVIIIAITAIVICVQFTSLN